MYKRQPVSGVRDIVTDACGGIGDMVEELAERILQCVQYSPQEYSMMCDSARQVVSEYMNIETYILQVMECYN